MNEPGYIIRSQMKNTRIETNEYSDDIFDTYELAEKELSKAISKISEAMQNLKIDFTIDDTVCDDYDIMIAANDDSISYSFGIMKLVRVNKPE